MKKRLFAILMLAIIGIGSVSARKINSGGVPNLINADNKSYHFGFILGLNTLDFNPVQSGIPCEEDGKVWYGDDTAFQTGFTIGMISDLRLAEYLDLRFTPTLYFGERQMRFRSVDGDFRPEGDITVKSNLISFPLLLKLRGQRVGNFRPYLIGGAAATLGVGRDKEAPMMLTAFDYGVEAGFGFEIYLPYFRLCPEIKAFFGLKDVLERNRADIANSSDLKYTNALEKLTSRIFALSFNFE